MKSNNGYIHKRPIIQRAASRKRAAKAPRTSSWLKSITITLRRAIVGFDKTCKVQCHEEETVENEKFQAFMDGRRLPASHVSPIYSLAKGAETLMRERGYHVRQLHFQSGARKKKRNGNGIRFGRARKCEWARRERPFKRRKKAGDHREIDSRVGQYIHWLRRPHDAFALCTSHGAISCVLAAHLGRESGKSCAGCARRAPWNRVD